MDSPLSDIDIDEVIADSEGEEYQAAAIKNRASTSKYKPIQDYGEQQQESSMMGDGSNLNFFAGFDDNILQPSIADRAKMRQRKHKEQSTSNVLELTDDDELMLKPTSSKPKKKNKAKKATQVPAEKTLTSKSSPEGMGTPSTSGSTSGQLINAKSRVRPRPLKKTPVLPQPPQVNPASQSTIPVLISPFRPLPNSNPDDSFRFDLPPSDPPITSSFGRDKDLHVPPIEYLHPLEDTDNTPLPSSFPGENVDELQVPNQHDQLEDTHSPTFLPPLPPTFFAGSSSLPTANPPTLSLPKPPPPPPIDIVDLTDIPPTGLALSGGNTDPATNVKAKKPKKPRKKKDKVGTDDLATAEAPQATSRKKKGKAKINNVTVEIPLPPPPAHESDQEHVPVSKKRKMQQMIDDPSGGDGLNIGAGRLEPLGGPSSSRPLLFTEKDSERALGDSGPMDLNEPVENPSKSDKRKGKRRKDTGFDDAPPATVSRKKNKDSEAVEVQEDPSEADLPGPPKRVSKKRKKGGEDLADKDVIEATQATRSVKGRRRLIVPSDDEESGSVPPAVEEPLVPSPDPEHFQNGSKGSRPEDDISKAADQLEDDRSVLKDTQPARTRSPSLDKATVPQTRFETPFVNKYPSLASRYTIAPKNQTSGISELLRRGKSHPNSPFPTAGQRDSDSPKTGVTYSPYLKSSRRALSRIAPLHPNRKTPPPPIPPPPPKKKSKKELEMEERWEEEIVEEIGGVAEWLALSEREKKDLKRMKRDREMGLCED